MQVKRKVIAHCAVCDGFIYDGEPWEPMLELANDASTDACETIHAAVCFDCLDAAEQNLAESLQDEAFDECAAVHAATLAAIQAADIMPACIALSMHAYH